MPLGMYDANPSLETKNRKQPGRQCWRERTEKHLASPPWSYIQEQLEFLRQQQGGGGVCSMGVNNNTSFIQGDLPYLQTGAATYSKHPKYTCDFIVFKLQRPSERASLLPDFFCPFRPGPQGLAARRALTRFYAGKKMRSSHCAYWGKPRECMLWEPRLQLGYPTEPESDRVQASFGHS